MLRKKHLKYRFSKLSMGQKAQISVEYLFILAMALAIIVPGSILFYNYSKDSNDQIVSSQINRIGTRIVNEAKIISTKGENTWGSADINIPDSCEEMFIMDGSELIITYQTSAGLTRAVFFSDTQINASYGDGNVSPQFHTGRMKIRIKSMGDYVLIEERVS